MSILSSFASFCFHFTLFTLTLPHTICNHYNQYVITTHTASHTYMNRLKRTLVFVLSLFYYYCNYFSSFFPHIFLNIFNLNLLFFLRLIHVAVNQEHYTQYSWSPRNFYGFPGQHWLTQFKLEPLQTANILFFSLKKSELLLNKSIHTKTLRLFQQIDVIIFLSYRNFCCQNIFCMMRKLILIR